LLFIGTFATAINLFPVQKIVIYSLMFLFSVALSYETISYFSKKISDEFFAEADDYESENDETESNKPDSEKKNLLEDLYIHSNPSITANSQSHFTHFTNPIFSTSDYRKTVFSPPEPIVV
jgi:hypothetical protein